jgi:hypothetical protein
MSSAFICEGVRTPIGRYGGALAQVRTDDLAAIPLRELRDRFPKGDWESIDEVIFGCANQAGEDNRNVARMALLLSGIPHTVPAMTVNRLCGSGMEADGGGAGDRCRRDFAGHCRRRGKYEPCAVCNAKSGERIFANSRNLRHNHRMAIS